MRKTGAASVPPSEKKKLDFAPTDDMYRTRAAAASPSEKTSPIVDLRAELPGAPRRKRDQAALLDQFPLPAGSRRAGSMPPIALVTSCFP